ncbi:MAG: hypothetical protein IPN76_34675 [Saprospiraceae bacterium]|nr:hypothetical protein [Saprospiraceae bacterium]
MKLFLARPEPQYWKSTAWMLTKWPISNAYPNSTHVQRILQLPAGNIIDCQAIRCDDGQEQRLSCPDFCPKTMSLLVEVFMRMI